MGDIRKLVLADLREPGVANKPSDAFLVVEANNTTKYIMGQKLNEKTVDDLCNFTTFEVKIRPLKKGELKL